MLRGRSGQLKQRPPQRQASDPGDGRRGFAIGASPHLSPRSLKLPPGAALAEKQGAGRWRGVPHREAVNVQGPRWIRGRFASAPDYRKHRATPQNEWPTPQVQRRRRPLKRRSLGSRGARPSVAIAPHKRPAHRLGRSRRGAGWTGPCRRFVAVLQAPGMLWGPAKGSLGGGHTSSPAVDRSHTVPRVDAHQAPRRELSPP